MKPFVIIALCGVFAVYAQSNETVVEIQAGNSTEVASAEVPDASVAIVEPADSKQTISLQSAEKPIVKIDDDNSNMIAGAVDSAKNAAKDAANTAANAADSASNTLSAAADKVAGKAAEARQSAEQTANGIVGNGSPSTFIASSLVLAIAFFNSINRV